MTYRLAVVQHGDYREALQITESNTPEPYAGMHYSVRSMEHLIQGTATRIISLDAPPYHETRAGGDLVGISPSGWKRGKTLFLGWKAYRLVREFKPTHVLIRTGGLIALPTLRYAVKHRLSSLVMMAGYVRQKGRSDRWMVPYLVRLLNDPSVFRVGNHRKPAADSLVAVGVDPAKVVAWDNPPASRPSDHPVKSLDRAAEVHVVFAGAMVASKGIFELLEAVTQLNQSGTRTRLTACGAGADLDALRARAAANLPGGLATFPGRVGNDEIMALMERATVVCVPSRRDSSEGFPYVATEALACRTPLICSDHNCFTDLLADGEGLRYFPSGDVARLADRIREVTTHSEDYARLSEATAAAFDKVIAPTLLSDVFEAWRAEWDAPSTKPAKGAVAPSPR